MPYISLKINHSSLFSLRGDIISLNVITTTRLIPEGDFFRQTFLFFFRGFIYNQEMFQHTKYTLLFFMSCIIEMSL